MFRDTSKELARLEAELLAEEAEEEQLPGEEGSWLYEENEEDAFENYSNNYGKKSGRDRSGYRAYNADETDEDLERYSEQVRTGGPKIGCLAVLLCLACVGIAAAAVIWLAYERGFL